MVLTQDSSGYTLAYRDNSTERYDTTSKLLYDTSSSGQITNYGYDTNGRLSTVTDAFGHALTFAYNSSNHVATVTDPAGNLIGYTYDGNNNLTQVNYPDSTAKIYYYEDTNNPHSLTGIAYVDSLGNATRFSTFGYYHNSNNAADPSNGRVTLAQYAQTDNGSPQEKFTAAYDAPATGQTTVTDPVGTQEVMTFATNLGVKNLIAKTSSIDTKSLTQAFDGNNNLTCRKDEEGHVTTYTYNSTNQKLSMTEGLLGDCTNPQNTTATRTTSYQYLSPALDLPTVISSPSVASGQFKTTTIQYTDTSHPNLPTIITQSGYTPAGASVSRAVTLGYNTRGQVSSIDGPRTDVSDVTTLTYSDCTTGYGCGQLSSVTNALGHVTTYDSYDANGRLLQMTDPNGLKTAYTYDPRGRVKTVTLIPKSGASALWQYSYTVWSDVSQVIDPDGVVLNYDYDAAHYLRTITDAAGNQIRYAYDLKGNRTQDYIYDPSGNLTRSVGYAYDLRNHLSSINLAGNTTQLVYDAVGNLTKETDPNNYATNYTPDPLNRLIQIIDPVNGANAPTGYGYNVNDQATAVTTPNNVTTQYRYDDLGNRLREISPDRGTTVYTYDNAGNVLTVTNALGQTTTYAYDALNRVVSKTSSDSNTPSYTYAYDSCLRGRLCNVSRNGFSHLIFNYDGLGRLNYELDFIVWLHSAYVFSPAGRLTQITYSNGRTANYQYDAVGQVNQVSTTSSGGVTTTLASNFTYAPFGPVHSFTFGNGLSYVVNVDQAYRPTSQTSGPRSKSALYDRSGNLAHLNDANNSTQTFAYDGLNELTAASDTQSGSYGSLGYTYLANGNRGSNTRNGTTTNYSYPYSNNWLSATNTGYWLTDATGNTTFASGSGAFGYDAYGRLTSSASGAATYGYNAFDLRTTKNYNGTATSFAYGPQGELLYETDGATSRVYVYANGIPLARINGANIYYYHTDQLGAPQLMTNSAGTTVWAAYTEPFGSATVTVNTITNNLRLPGMYADQETGLYYNGYRYYDPTTGRYISSDPIGLAGGLNTYTYALNNPLRYIDPSGLDIRLENTTSVFGFHQRTSVDIPPGAQLTVGNYVLRNQFGISFGLPSRDTPEQGLFEAYGDIPGPGKPGSGIVYPDFVDPTTKVQETFKTTPEEDALAIQYFIKQLGNTGKYNAASNSCRDYSKEQFDAVKNLIEQNRIRERIKPFGEVYIK